jgi:hypothetical protein
MAWGDKGEEYRPDCCTHPAGEGCMWCCERCNRDEHRCPGCGTVADHDDRPCQDCEML